MNARHDHQHADTVGQSPRPHSSVRTADTADTADTAAAAGHAAETFIDPVCGMTVAPDSLHAAEHAGPGIQVLFRGLPHEVPQRTGALPRCNGRGRRRHPACACLAAEF